jgi:AcrR family transcriptional regulator
VANALPASRANRRRVRKRARSARAATRGRAKGRTQAERTAETRTRIIEAVHTCISELGYARTTASEIAKRAGVTWGAAQHHFGGKDGILIAVLEDSFERFAAKLAEVPDEAPLAERVAQFVERAWEHFASPHYRSTFEILLHAADVLPRDASWRARMEAAWSRIWAEVFAGEKLPRRRAVALQQFAVASLAGLASLRMLEGEGAQARAGELELLRGALLRELGAA